MHTFNKLAAVNVAIGWLSVAIALVVLQFVGITITSGWLLLAILAVASYHGIRKAVRETVRIEQTHKSKTTLKWRFADTVIVVVYIAIVVAALSGLYHRLS